MQPELSYYLGYDQVVLVVEVLVEYWIATAIVVVEGSEVAEIVEVVVVQEIVNFQKMYLTILVAMHRVDGVGMATVPMAEEDTIVWGIEIVD